MLATLIVATARTASAQQTGNCKATKQWQLEQVEKDHIKLTGQVEIDCGNESMSADQVEIFQDTNVMIATGNVVFTSGGSRIAADRLEYNTRTRTGTFFNGFGTSTMHESRGPRRPTQTSQFTPVGAVRPAAAARRQVDVRGGGSRHLLLRREDLEGGAGEVPHHPRRLHDVRAADAPLAAHVGHGDAEPEALRQC
jgi:lipopolysaccharide export system protein LptA